MKNCPKCGASCEDTFAFCPHCTTPLTTPTQEVPASAPKKSHKKAIFLTTAIVAVVAIAAVCVWAFFLRGNENIHKSPENVVEAYITACMKENVDKCEDCLLVLEVEGDPGILVTSFGTLSGSKIESFDIKSSSEPDEDQLWDIESSLDAAGFDPEDFEEYSNVKVKIKLSKESFSETYVCGKRDEEWFVLWPEQLEDEPDYSNLQKTDLANARALKSLVVADYMCCDPDSVTKGRGGTFYLSDDGQHLQATTDDCITVSSELWGGLTKGEPILVTIDDEGIVTNTIPYIPQPTE